MHRLQILIIGEMRGKVEEGVGSVRSGGEILRNGRAVLVSRRKGGRAFRRREGGGTSRDGGRRGTVPPAPASSRSEGVVPRAPVAGPRRRRDALPQRRGRDAPILRTEFGFDSRVLPGPGRPPARVVPPAPATADARRGVSNSPEVENRQRENRSLGASDSGIFRSKLSGAESRRIRRRKFNSPCRIGFSEFFESLAARLNSPTNHASDTRSFEFEKKLTRGMRVGIERARRPDRGAIGTSYPRDASETAKPPGRNASRGSAGEVEGVSWAQKSRSRV